MSQAEHIKFLTQEIESIEQRIKETKRDDLVRIYLEGMLAANIKAYYELNKN